MNFRLLLAAVLAFSAGADPAAADDPQWSFEPLAADVLPRQVDSPWIANPVDGFILEKLKEYDLKPQGKADRHSLIRRVTATLPGLPPSIEGIEAFITDSSPDA